MKQIIIGWGTVLSLALVLFGMTSAAAQSGVDDPAQVEAGQAIYETNCAGCHGADGTGSDRGRPLTDVAAEAERSVHVTSVTDGIGVMPAFADRLEADEIDSAVSFVRLTFVSESADTTEAAETTEAAADEPALARTGPTATVFFVLGGVAVLLAGAMMVQTSRRA